MNTTALRAARKQAKWSQARLAQTLGVTQAYLSMMETGKRKVPDRLVRKVARLFHLPATALPLPSADGVDRLSGEATLEAGLARLGYPGLAYRRKPGEVWNPAALLLAALGRSVLDSRLAEALPWLLLRFEGWDFPTLVVRAKSRDLQNRLGFTVALAREVAERSPSHAQRVDELRRLEALLDSSRLAKEDTFGRSESGPRMRAWVRESRSEAAKHWNLLTDLKVEHLPYASQHP